MPVCSHFEQGDLILASTCIYTFAMNYSSTLDAVTSESALSRRSTRDISPSYESIPLNGIGAKHFTSVRAQVGMGLCCASTFT